MTIDWPEGICMALTPDGRAMKSPEIGKPGMGQPAVDYVWLLYGLVHLRVVNGIQWFSQQIG